MDLNKKLEELKPHQLNCNVFDVYSYNGLTMQDLLCQFFTKINECITVSNETIDLAKWLVNEGLEIEVVKKLMIWLEDGTLENIINVNLFNTLNNNINNLDNKLEHIAIDVRNFGAKGDGVTDDTYAIKNALLSHKTLYFSKGDYLITDPLIFEKHNITMHKESKILKNFDGVGVFIVGGSSYTTLKDFTIEGYGIGKSMNSVTQTEGHGIVVVGSRIEFNNVNSFFNRGCGVKFISLNTIDSGYTLPNYKCNMNKCKIDKLYSYGNDGNGVVFEGNQDDMSVWIFNIHTQQNRGNGVLFNDECMFRDSEGFIYSENDGLNNNNNSHSIHIKKARNIIFTIYSEGQNNENANEIMVEEGVMCNIISLRNNRDVNKSNSIFINGNGEIITTKKGIVGTNKDSDIFSNNKINVGNMFTSQYSDFNLIENMNKKYFERLTYSNKTKYEIDKTNNKVIKISSNNKECVGGSVVETKQMSQGSIDLISNVNVGDVLYSQPVQGYKDGGYRNAGKIEYVVSSVGTGKIGCNIVFYVSSSGDNNFNEAIRILENGMLQIKALEGVGTRNISVNASGVIVAQ